MKFIWGNIKIDKILLVLVVMMGVFSFAPVYSASIGLAFQIDDYSTGEALLKHAFLVGAGFLLLGITQKIPYKYFSPFSIILLGISIVLLAFTLYKGTTIGNANASRWIILPVVGFSFQPSAFAAISLMLYLSRYLSKAKGEFPSFKKTFYKGLLPILIICGLILPANFSTAALIFLASTLMLFIGNYPLKYIGYIFSIGIATLAVFILLVMAFPNISNRVATWKARIENFASGNAEANYQVEKGKLAIANGYFTGSGPGKSLQKHFLPQSTSDFIFAIIVEEYGLIGGLIIIWFYAIILIRLINIVRHTRSAFGKYAVMGLGLYILLQALVNLSVAVNLIPVTGQTLPLISAGGTSIWLTCFAFGIIFAVSRGDAEPANDQDPQPEPTNELNEIAHA